MRYRRVHFSARPGCSDYCNNYRSAAEEMPDGVLQEEFEAAAFVTSTAHSGVLNTSANVCKFLYVVL
jgi:hypothetical protein